MENILFVISATLAAVIGFLLVSFCALLVKIYTGKSFKNPHYAPVICTVLNKNFSNETRYDYQTDVARKHHTFRVLAPGQSVICTTDPRNIEHITKINFSKYSKGQYERDVVTEFLGDGIFNANGDKWLQQRKPAALELSTRNLRDFSCAVFKRNAAKLAETIADTIIKNQTFDMQDLLTRCILDSIFKVGFGMDLNWLRGSSQEGRAFIQAFNDCDELVSLRLADPIWKLKRFLNIGSEATLKKNIKVIDDFLYGIIRSKRMMQQYSSNDEDIFLNFLFKSKNIDPREITDKFLRDIIINFASADKEGTSTALSWFFYMLCKHPLIQEKLAQQIREVVDDDGKEKETNIDDFVSKLTDDKLEKMHYLHAALSETLRLYPSTPVDGRTSEMDDILPDGFRLKKGDGIYYIAYAMGRMTYIWGEDAEDFRPERWLRNGVFQPESPFKFVAFHAGPRMCLGKEYAYRQMKIVSMVLLRFFQFKLADETKQVTYGNRMTLNINGGLHLRATSRLDLTKSNI